MPFAMSAEERGARDGRSATRARLMAAMQQGRV